jgi:hypothetical protein
VPTEFRPYQPASLWHANRRSRRCAFLLGEHIGVLRLAVSASSSHVVSAGDVSKPILVTSTELKIEIVRDDNWSHQQLRLAVDRFEEAQSAYLLRGWNASDPGPGEFVQQTETALEMDKSAEIIRFLDTEESLREAVPLRWLAQNSDV